MPDFLTRRNGTWHFVRRVPVELATFDRRGIIRHSTRVQVATDRTGRRAIRVAERLNAELEAYWHQLCGNRLDDAARGYDEARRRARSLGFEYAESGQILSLPWRNGSSGSKPFFRGSWRTTSGVCRAARHAAAAVVSALEAV